MKNILFLFVSWMFLFIWGCNFEDPYTLNRLGKDQSASSSASATVSTSIDRRKMARSVYDFTLFDISAQPVPLERFQGKVLLIVNTASRCGYTAQLRELQTLYRQYQSQGLEVLAFPSNDFGGQELETNEEVALFATTQFGIDFPLFAKTRVRGSDQHPLFGYLTTQGPVDKKVRYNFEKFLVDRTGKVIARYSSDVVPLSEEIVTDIERALAFSA
ncbi:glutathione peroxidase [Nitrospira sp. T9]|uniref:glutathione peroxidase n=2 Tax=unclassified Nitrospira TaxID=2652172 RepID=UPI003F9D0159